MNPKLSDQNVRNYVLAQHILSETELNYFETLTQTLNTDSQTRTEAAFLYQIDLAKQVLRISQYTTGSILADIPLYTTEKPQAIDYQDWEYWGKDLLHLDAETGKMRDKTVLLTEQTHGLLVTPHHSFLYLSEFENQMVVPETHYCLDWRVPKKKLPSSPYDLYISSQHRYVFVCDRSAGTILLVCPTSHTALAQLKVRKSGSLKKIHLAIDDINDKVYITDNETSNLQILNLKNFHLSQYQPGLGILGNIILDKNPRYVYLVTLKPQAGFKYMDTETLEVIKSIKLKGNFLSLDSDYPCDLLGMTPNKSHVLLMTYQNEPEPFTPIINVIDTEEVRPVLRYALKDGTKPVLLVNDTLNPFYTEENLSLYEVLQEQGILSADDLTQLQTEPVTDKKCAAWDLDQRQYEVLMGEGLPVLRDEDAPQIKLPKEAEEEIEDILLTTFQQSTGIQLRDYPREMDKMEELAFQLRQELELRPLVHVNKYHFFLNHFSLKTSLHRDAILMLLELRKSLQGKVPPMPPYRCPRCTALLLGRWLCSACGFQSESPELARKRSLRTIEADTLATPGDVICLVPQEQALVLLNRTFQKTWSFDFKKVGLENVSDVRILPGHHVLVTDPVAGRILELSEFGQIVWEQNAFEFKRPAKTTWYTLYGKERFVILDPGLRQVVELTREHDVLWQYGGPDSQALGEPVDVQRTHHETYLITDREKKAVFEVDQAGQLIKTHGKFLSLKDPVFARRLFNEQLVIVDQGRHLVYLLDQDGQLSFEFNYQPDVLPPEKRLKTISWATLAQNGDLILGDGEKLLAITFGARSIHWILRFSDLQETVQIEADDNDIFIPPSPLEQRLSFLEAQPLFRGMPEEALRLLAESMTPISFRAGQTIIREGEKGTCLYVIMQGTVQVFKSGNDSVVASLQSGTIFGEMAMYLLENRTATVIAKTDCYLLRLDHGPFRKIMQNFPEINQRFKQLSLERKRLLHQRNMGKHQEAVEQLKAKMAISRMKRLKIFHQMDPAIFAALKDKLYSVSYPSNHFVFRYKDPVKHLYFISRGNVEVLAENERLISTLPEGEVFGEIALLLESHRTASVRTKGYCELFQLDKQVFYEVLKQVPALKNHLQEIARQRLEHDPGVMHDRYQQEIVPNFEKRLFGTRSDQPLLYICDLFSRQIIGLDHQGSIQWRYGAEVDDIKFLQPRRIFETPTSLLIVDAGHNRVIELDKQTQGLIQEFGQTLKLLNPASAMRLEDGDTIIADQGNERLIRVNQAQEIVWKFHEPELLLSPVFAELTPEEQLLIADNEMHQIIEMTQTGQVVWHYGEPLIASESEGHLSRPNHVTRLANTHTLISDTGNNRVLEVNLQGEIIWQFVSQPDLKLVEPLEAQRLENGHTLIIFDQQQQLVEVDPVGQIVWHYAAKEQVPV